MMRYCYQDYITDEMFHWKMTRRDKEGKCTVDITNNTYMRPGMVFDNTPRGIGEGSREVAYFLEADENIIESSPIYTPAAADGSHLAYINFCTQLSLDSDHNGMLVNWMDIEFFFYIQKENVGFWPDRRTLLASTGFSDEDYDPEYNILPAIPHYQRRRHLLRCYDGFSIVFGVAASTQAPTAPTASPAPSGPTAPPVTGFIIKPENAIDMDQVKAFKNATDEYGVIGYLCDDNLERLSETNQATFVQRQGGSTIKVCVERNAKAVRNGVYLRQIDAFSFFRGIDVRQIAVAPLGKAATDGLTELHCQRGTHKCWFETLLIAKFFTTPGFVSGSGAATLQFGSASSRQLEDGEERHLQEQEVAEDDLRSTRAINIVFQITTEAFLAAEEALGNKKTQKEGKRISLWGYVGIVGVIVFVVVGLVVSTGKNRSRRIRKEPSAAPRKSQSKKGIGDQSRRTLGTAVGDEESMGEHDDVGDDSSHMDEGERCWNNEPNSSTNSDSSHGSRGALG
jgi:hypothetical protein